MKHPRRLTKHGLFIGDGLLGTAVAFKVFLSPLVRSRIFAGAARMSVRRSTSLRWRNAKSPSRSIRSRTCSRACLNPSVVTTCTGHPSSSSKSPCEAACANRLPRSPISTSRSTSLPGPVSPRATEPNTRTVVAPRRAAMRMTSSRRRRGPSRLGAGFVGRGYESGRRRRSTAWPSSPSLRKAGYRLSDGIVTDPDEGGT
jgi:hypothetical protein